jgi:4,5-dihydroxyphthalate decarboxylase
MLRLSIATGRYDRTSALRDGRVRIEGVDPTFIPMKVEEIFWRMLRHLEFDVSELSLAGYTVRRGRGLDDLIAIPVFLSRSFRHNIIYVNADAGIDTPDQIAGKKVGVPEYQITAAVWARGLLEDEYGVRPEDCEWHQGGLETWGRKPFEPISPEGVTIVETPEGATLAKMLEEGDIDALISPRVPSTYRDGSGAVRRVFTDAASEEKAYYGHTGIFPIMHTVAIKASLIDQHPWLPVSLMKAFEEAKHLAVVDVADTTAHHITLPFLRAHYDETVELMGEDFWPYGLDENRPALEAFLRYAHRQQLIPEPIEAPSLFPESTWMRRHI